MDLLSLLMVVPVCVLLADMAGYVAFSRYAYELGPRVYHGVDPTLPRPGVPPGTVFETPTGSFTVVSADRVLVRERLHLFDLHHSGVRLIFDWRKGKALLDARPPIAVLVAGAIALFARFAEERFQPAGLLVVGLMLLVLASMLSIKLANTQARLLVSEYHEWCAAGRPCA